MMIDRQTFLDAAGDEDILITTDEREIIRCADDFKWALFIARLLVRAVKPGDLDILKKGKGEAR